MQDIVDTSNDHYLNFEDLKILVWNVYKEGKPGIYTDIDLLTQNIDLAFFQEGYLNKTFLNIICSRENLNWKMAKSFADSSGVYSGVITASHQNPYQSYALISPNTEPFTDIHKMMLVSLYHIPKHLEKLMVINLHGINFVSQGAWENQINVIADTIKKHRGPLILAGDFNSYTDGRTQYLLNLMKKLGLSHAKITGNEYQGIFILDHLFYRGFELTKSEALKSITTSDHVPLYFELHLLKN
jgi:endonuclease/exonuclease/phosphatase (EEP) superfamily protein YafD